MQYKKLQVNAISHRCSGGKTSFISWNKTKQQWPQWNCQEWDLTNTKENSVRSLVGSSMRMDNSSKLHFEWFLFLFFVRGKMYISFWAGRMLRSYICFVTLVLFLSETSVAHLGGSDTSHPLFTAQLIPLQISVVQVPVLLYTSLSWELNKQNGSSLSQS